jgi:hypothetical protein
MEIIIAVAFLLVATVFGLLLSPTDAEIEARMLKPPTAPEYHAAHDDHGHGH